MKITKQMIKETLLKPHGEQIVQYYKLSVAYKGKDNPKAEQHKNTFLILAGYKTNR